MEKKGLHSNNRRQAKSPGLVSVMERERERVHHWWNGLGFCTHLGGFCALETGYCNALDLSARLMLKDGHWVYLDYRSEKNDCFLRLACT